LGAALAALPLHAQQRPPGIGDVLRDVERTRPDVPPQPQPRLDVDQPPRPALDAAATASFRVESIRLSGVTALPEDELLALVAGYTRRDVTLAELAQATERITRHYRDRGYLLARAYIPAQEIRDGVLEIAVLEGRHGRVEVRDAAGLAPRLAAEAVAPLRPGEAINESALDRALLLLDDLGGVSARGTLSPGQAAGTADLAVELAAQPRYGGTVSVDNYGNRYTGRARFGGSAYAHNLAGRGDTLSARGLVAEGADLAYGQLGYDLPLSGDGWRAGALATYTDYTLGRELSDLGATGNAAIGTVYARYALLRSRHGSVHAQLAADYKDLEDRIDSVASFNPRNVWLTTLTLAADAPDAVLAGGVTSASLAVSYGQLDIEDATARAIDQATARADGSFRKLSYSLVRVQDLAPRWQLYAAVSGQWASKNLDPVEKFSLGGPFGVRAYPTGEAPGDAGVLGTLELRYLTPVPDTPLAAQFVAFVDSGSVTVNREPFTLAPNGRTLTGAGVGVNLFGWQGVELRLSYAWRLGSQPALSDDGETQRGWVQLIKAF
jgi:hemolysin activation/secretion protein